MRLETDDSKCFGCHICENVCSVELAQEINPKKAGIRIRGHFPVPGNYSIAVCNQCGECAAACPEGAIVESGGIYRIDPVRCSGCAVCIDACPTGVMFVHQDSYVPIKCVACGKCAELCTRHALKNV